RAPAGSDWTAAERRWTAAELLRDIGPAAGTAGADALVQALADSDAHVRTTAVQALESVGPASPEVVPALTARLKTDDAREAARAAVPALRELANDPEAIVRDAAKKSLGSLGEK